MTTPWSELVEVDELLDGEPVDGREIGRSREGRAIEGHEIGRGPVSISLIAGCHADEPVGPAMLDLFAGWLTALDRNHPLLQRFRFVLVPHVNPDGEENNSGWTRSFVSLVDHAGRPDLGYELRAYLDGVERELPGHDLEFGFPRDSDDTAARPEARAVASFMASAAPIALHTSFHGMGFAHGPWFLIDAFWVERSRPLRRALTDRVAELGYHLHDVDRGGEKGFWRIAPGFTTRPDSRGMRDFFLARDDTASGDRFRPSSMEHARSLGGDPLTLVSEMPLFLLPDTGPISDPALPRLERLARLAELGDGARVRPMPIRDQMRLQLALLAHALDLVG